MAEDTYSLLATIESPDVLEMTIETPVNFREIAATSNELTAVIQDPQELFLSLETPATISMQLGATQGPPGPPGVGTALIRRFERIATIDGIIHYLGHAPQGSLTTESVWTICRLYFDLEGSIIIRGKAENGSWDLRSILTYIPY